MSESANTYVYDRKVSAIHKLRVNIKSLAAEAKIIRQEARRAGPGYREELTSHRRDHLRVESRVAHLALAFARSRAYKSVESGLTPPLELVNRIGMKLAKAGLITPCLTTSDGGLSYTAVRKWMSE